MHDDEENKGRRALLSCVITRILPRSRFGLIKLITCSTKYLHVFIGLSRYVLHAWDACIIDGGEDSELELWLSQEQLLAQSVAIVER